MATTLTSASVHVKLKWLYENVLDIANAKDLGAVSKTVSYTDGEGANALEAFWRDDRSVAITTEDPIDVAGTSIQDAFGNNITMKAIKLLYVENTGTSTITLGGNSAEVPYMAAVNDKIKILPGGFFLWVASDATGIAVTATTGDIISITGGSAVSPYRIVVGYTK